MREAPALHVRVGGPSIVDTLTNALTNFDEFQKSLRCFENWLVGCVPGAMDVDVLIERRGRFWIAELKPWKNGVAVSYGAHLSLSSLVSRDGISVYLVGEDTVDGQAVLHVTDYSRANPHIGKYKGRMEAWFGPEHFEDTDVPGLRALVRGWWDDASAAA